MNKAIKGAIAAGAAGILLLGGAGTFATWRDSAAVDAGTVATGQLSLSAAEGRWTETSSPLVTVDPGTFQIVPGDSLRYTATVSVQATGDNLDGELKIEEDSYLTALGDVPDVSVDVDHTAVSIADQLTVNGNVMTFVERDAPYVFDVTVTVTFADSISQSLLNQDAPIDLNNLELTIEQV